MKRTKIVATLGPASNSTATLRSIIASGVDVVRLNFSHGTTQEKENLVKEIREAARIENKIVGILADLQGPKIRIAKFRNGAVNLQTGATFILDSNLSKDDGDENIVGIDYSTLPHDVKTGDILLLDDGRIVLAVTEIKETQVVCEIKVGGILSNNKGINKQFGGLSADALTTKDREDLRTAVLLEVDYIAISFVRSKKDVEEAKALIVDAHGTAGIIAKIERMEAIASQTLQEIIAVADGIMVARGDLGVEIGEVEIPSIQKLIISSSRAQNKPVITATQMMETMIHNIIPTRAEVSDVANAVWDGTDAVMLSAETATGDHPSAVVQTMNKICVAAEKHPNSLDHMDKTIYQCGCVHEAIVLATTCIAKYLEIGAIITFTETGKTPLEISKIRSKAPIYGLSHSSTALGKMSLYNNVYPIKFDPTKFTDEDQLKIAAIAKIKEMGLVKIGDKVVIITKNRTGLLEAMHSLTILSVN